MVSVRLICVWTLLVLCRGRDDVNIEFVNNCGFDVSFAWYATSCSGSKPNVLYMNERVSSGQTTSRTAPVAEFAGGRVYSWAAEGQTLVAGMPQEVFSHHMSLSTDERCSSDFSQYMMGAPPFMGWAAFAELTLTHTATGIINDADISMVDQFYLPMSWDWIYSDTSGLNAECHNTSLQGVPDEASCNANGGSWSSVASTPYVGAPSGYCKSPNILCQDPSEHAVCSASFNEFANLITQIDSIYGDLQADTLSSGAPAFEWANSNRNYFPGQVWTCAGFQNAHNFKMAEMCGALNRGLCDLSAVGQLSATDFASWTQNSCGSKQNQQDPQTWFAAGNVRNPYVYWLRRTLGGSTYSFSQDEGIHGGNTNCNNINPTTSRVPDYSRIVVCPGNTPSPSPSPSSWSPCGTGSAACCDPDATPTQVCPGGETCEDCGGGSSCECPTSPAPAPPAPPTPAPTGNICTSIHSLNCYGYELSDGHLTGIGTHDACCNACIAHSGCNAWSWHYSSGDCYLKSACVDQRADDAYHSGYTTSQGASGSAVVYV